MRRFGDPVRPDVSYTHRPGVYAILPRDGALLLTHQLEPEPEFQLPGGGIDPGESPMRALHREVYEETGWRIGTPRRVGVYKRFAYMPEYDLWAEKICTIWMARPIRPMGPPTEPGHMALWTPAEAALELLANDGERAILAQILAAAPR
ncbi:NUDIX hydrolase [Oceanicola sp. 22II-s10i]|uniref:NUDIX domain-containing protein n=1 Tax=Oceanicola sp. 22II-s10i TaxID=1317116 RepID=UPI000B51FACF|nr:NUDIX hydrolase [Oceanicola sp. 22II-s10i]OWU85998.1 NUDIX hydrolase [Oceanicola sp. 22II-s10i]